MQTIQSTEAQTVRRFLLVDDHPIVCEAIRLALETIASDIRVDFAPAYAEARRALQTNPHYDCVLLDTPTS
jgi:CheY-like chemotaxis protein